MIQMLRRRHYVMRFPPEPNANRERRVSPVSHRRSALHDQVRNPTLPSGEMVPLTRQRIVFGARVALLGLGAAWATARAGNYPWSVRVWRDDGPPNVNVAAIIQTDDRFLWLASRGTLTRFDGNGFEAFPDTSLTPPLSGEVARLLRTRDNAIVAALTDGSLARFAGGRETLLTQKIMAAPLASLVEDARGVIWVALENGTVWRVSGDDVHRVTAADGYPDGGGGFLATDVHGQVWWVKRQYTGVIRDDRFVVVNQTDRLQKRLAAARDGDMWLCSGLRLFKCDDRGKLDYRGAMQLRNLGTRATALLEDRKGDVWIGMSPGGLFRYDGKTFENIPASSPDISSLFEDDEGNIWVGTTTGGLDRVRPRAIAVEGAETDLPFESMRLLCQDANGQIWGTTEDRTLVRRTEAGWSLLPNNHDILRGERVTALASAPDGAIWVGSDAHDLHRISATAFKHWEQKDGVLARVITALAVDRNSRVWIAGYKRTGLQVFEHDTFTTLPSPPNIQPLRTIVEAPSGEMWAGGDQGELWRVANDRIIDETVPLSPLRERICALHFTADGALWIGYASGGLARVKDGHASVIGVAQGLFDDHIAELVADDRGWLWCGTSKGIFKLRLDELNAVADGRTSRVQPLRYSDENLAALHASFDGGSGALRSRDGRLWIPMGPTLAIIAPSKLRDNFAPPPVLIREVAIDDRAIARYGGLIPPTDAIDLRSARMPLRISSLERKAAFEFTALTFGDNENVRFRYRLAGFDAEWIDAGNRRTASYSRLPPGTYRFEVTACNGDGVWNEQGAAVGLIVVPRWWQTLWFRLAALGLLIGAIFAVVRFLTLRRLAARLRTLEQQAAVEKERTRIARDLHDDLGGRLTQVVLLNELAEQETALGEPARERAREMASSVRQVIKALDETVWALNPRNDTLPDLIDYLSQFAVEFLRAAGIRCRVDLPDHPPALPVPADVRHHVFLVVKEALNNVARHAGASTVDLTVTLTARQLGITVRDDGHGFGDRSPDAQADGLRNMRERMNEIGGTLEIVSTPAGTQISLRWHLPP